MPEKPFFHVVLVEPEIPQNTGNIGRICCCTGCKLHLVEPISFSLDDAHVKRSGMDYWKHVDFEIHPDWNHLLQEAGDAPFHFFSTKGYPSFWDVPLEPGAWFVFGSESKGLAEWFHKTYKPAFCTIPMPGNFYRSLNLANSVAVAVYEGLRRLNG